MSTLQYYRWLATQAWESLFLSPVLGAITLTLSVAVGIAFFTSGTNLTSEGRRRALLVALTLAWFPVLTLGVGSVYRFNDILPRPAAPYWLLLGLFLVQIGASVFLTFACQGQRWYTAAMSTWVLWFSIWAMWVSLMSVTGDWI
jgi:hypothetical protein